MASIIDKKGIVIAGGFKLLAGSPIDARYQVESTEQLQSILSNGAGYEGLVVYNCEDHSEYICKVSSDTNELEFQPVTLGVTDNDKRIIINDAVEEANQYTEGVKVELISKIENADTSLDNKLNNLETQVTNTINGLDAEFNGGVSEALTKLTQVDGKITQAVFNPIQINQSQVTDLVGDLEYIQGKLDQVSNVMDFIGISTTDPIEVGATIDKKLITSPNAGDVCIYTNSEKLTYEYVYSGVKWEKFGIPEALTAAIKAANDRIDPLENFYKSLPQDGRIYSIKYENGSPTWTILDDGELN